MCVCACSVGKARQRRPCGRSSRRRGRIGEWHGCVGAPPPPLLPHPPPHPLPCPFSDDPLSVHGVLHDGQWRLQRPRAGERMASARQPPGFADPPTPDLSGAFLDALNFDAGGAVRRVRPSLASHRQCCPSPAFCEMCGWYMAGRGIFPAPGAAGGLGARHALVHCHAPLCCRCHPWLRHPARLLAVSVAVCRGAIIPCPA